MLYNDTSNSSNRPHQQTPGAFCTQQEPLRENLYNTEEINQLIEAETDKMLNHLLERLPKEVAAQFGGLDGMRKHLTHSFSQNYHEMLTRYVATAEDEMFKKVHQFIDREEMKMLNRYTPKEIAALLEQVGGTDKFTTAEIEKSIVSMYGHLHGYMQRKMSDLEASTNALLRQKTDVGSFIRGENAYSVVKCTFKDNTFKPKTVTDVKLSVNILDSELISPIFQYQVTAEYLIKDLISNHFMYLIDREIEQVKDQLIDEGKEELTDSEIVFAKLNKVADITDDDADNPAGKRYTAVSKELMSRLSHLHAEIDPQSFDQLNIRENIKRIIDSENIRNRGFNTIVNALTSILDNAKMGYQYIENLKNARQLIIREYDDMHEECLPDERYQIHLRYFDHAQLNEERKAYEIMIRSFEARIDHLWDVMQASYDKSKWKKGLIDFADLSRLYRRYIKKKYKDPAGEPSYEDEYISKVWDGVSFVSPAETEVEKMNRTFVYEKEKMAKKLTLMRERLQKMYAYQYPPKRRIMEEQLAFLETELQHFDYKINPFHLQPGLLLDIDITSIKRKRITLEAMANVINDFLHAISKGFTDQARASFNRRRSVLHTDFNHAFGGGDDTLAASGTDTDVNSFDMLDELPDGGISSEDSAADEYADSVVHDASATGNMPQEENGPLPDADDIHTPAIKKI